MLKRKREIEHMVSGLGLEITGFRTEGANHWRVDVKAPNGRQRPFTFGTHGHDGPRRQIEESQLRRWRREVMPELEEKEQRGEIEPPETMRSALAAKLCEVLPRHPAREPYLELKGTELVGEGNRKERAMNSPTVGDRNPAATPPPATPPSPAPTPPEQKRSYINAEKMTQSDVMRFTVWMNKERLAGFYARSAFCARATKELGFKVTDSVLVAWLEVNGVEMPRPPETAKPAKTYAEQLNDDVAAIALALTHCGLPQDQQDAMLAIVDRRTKG